MENDKSRFMKEVQMKLEFIGIEPEEKRVEMASMLFDIGLKLGLSGESLMPNVGTIVAMAARELN